MDHHRLLEQMYRRAPVNQLYQPTIQVSAGASVIEIAVKEEYFHAARAVHGAVLIKLLDDSCFFAVSSLVQDVFVLTVSFTTYLTRPVTGECLTSNGRVVHAGKNLFLAESVVTESGGKEVPGSAGSFSPRFLR